MLLLMRRYAFLNQAHPMLFGPTYPIRRSVTLNVLARLKV